MNESTQAISAASKPGGELIADRELCDLVRTRGRTLLELARSLAAMRAGEVCLTRPLIGRLLLESGQMETLLDEYGARQNHHWSRFRALTASVKNFARIGEVLAYVQRRLPTYRLLPVAGDFRLATCERLQLVSSVVAEIAGALLDEAQEVGIDVSGIAPPAEEFGEWLPPGRLARNRGDRIAGDTATTVTHLATEFLNLAAEGELLRAAAQVPPADYAACFPDPVSEERLRQLTFRFHNLQSLYDTHVAGTSIETSDAELPILRGHASVIYHLLEIATDLAHYYERHASPHTADAILRERPVVDTDATMATLFAYAMAFSSDYLAGGQRLCQGILRRYAESGRLDVPVPSYRGFHVRPSNLVARIVAHYGSSVEMELEGKRFDAASPLELFRANEAINARKRRWLASEIARVHPDCAGTLAPEAVAAAVLAIVHRLAGEGKIMLYRQPLQFSDQLGRREGSVLENSVAEIAQLQATGQLDIRTDLTVTFIGDRRVLTDVDILAHHGYGEDAFGNNVALPKALSYLRR
ncbi:MAG: HPr family phosphocarrier protein [Candidatus Accumulibacter sp.]|nr:HPr family phosphocarrier protein [Candidatus Accumulibacter necessarius]